MTSGIQHVILIGYAELVVFFDETNTTNRNITPAKSPLLIRTFQLSSTSLASSSVFGYGGVVFFVEISS
jgi:hypothetical protein